MSRNKFCRVFGEISDTRFKSSVLAIDCSASKTVCNVNLLLSEDVLFVIVSANMVMFHNRFMKLVSDQSIECFQ